MTKLEEHPTVRAVRERARAPAASLTRERIVALAREAGADDVGVVEIERPSLADQRPDLEAALPGVQTLVSFVVAMNRGPIRTPARSVANEEFHRASEDSNEIGRALVRALEAEGFRALNPPASFPMEMDRFPGKIWVVSHKPVAVEAGLGSVGIHRNVIHPRHGSFICLGTILLAERLDVYDRPLAYNPCLTCKLCVAACPVGAIHKDGYFDFSACYTHNYREFMSGFTEWVTRVAESRDQRSLRQRVDDSENASMWQSLSFGANYKAAYCIAVCPAGEEVISPFLEDRNGFLEGVVEPLQLREERVYVLQGSDSESYVARRFPHKRTRPVRNALRPLTISSFKLGMQLSFQRGVSEGLDARYHFTFTGDDAQEVTVDIRDRTLTVRDGLHDEPDLEVRADAATWLSFLAGETSMARALVLRRIRIKGPPKLLVAFGRCFPR